MTVLNSSIATTYCFQFCGPVSNGFSNACNQRGRWPSMTRARYKPTGTESSAVIATTSIGRVHIVELTSRPWSLGCDPFLEFPKPLGAQQHCQQIAEQQQHGANEDEYGERRHGLVDLSR